MRKTSQDGGDSASLTSGYETESKRSGSGLIKTKRNSIKEKFRKAQNFSLESDDGVGEPLLQKDKEKPECGNQSAKYLLSKTKTDSMSDKGDDKDKLLGDAKSEMPSMTNVPGITENQPRSNGIKDSQIVKSLANIAPIHNHMNTNVFSGSDALKSITPKSQILVEIEEEKAKCYSPSPLIFTTAKIHADGKTMPMELIHVTPVPILSTIEGNVVEPDHLKQNNVCSPLQKDNVSNDIHTKPGSKDSWSNRSPVTSSSGITSIFSESNSPLIHKITSLPQKNVSNDPQQSNLTGFEKFTPGQSVTKKDESPSLEKHRTKSSLEALTKTLPQTTDTHNILCMSDMKVTATSTKDTKPPQSTSNIKSISSECNGKIVSPIVVGAAPRTIEMDINRNIQIPNVISTQRSEPVPAVAQASYCKVTMGISKEDRSIITKTSAPSNKQLQQEKGFAVEVKVPSDSIQDLKSKTLEADKLESKESKLDNSQNSKDVTTSPKKSAKNLVSNAKITSSNVTAVSTSTKAPVESSVSLTTNPTSEKEPTDKKSVVASAPTTKTATVSTMKTSLNAATIASKTVNSSKSSTTTTAESSIPKLGTLMSSIPTKQDPKLSSAEVSKPTTAVSTSNISKPVVTKVSGATKLSTSIPKSTPAQPAVKLSTNAKTPASPGTCTAPETSIKSFSKTLSSEMTVPKTTISKTSSITSTAQSRTSEAPTDSVHSSASLSKSSTASVDSAASCASQPKPSKASTGMASFAASPPKSSVISTDPNASFVPQSKSSTVATMRTSSTKIPNTTKVSKPVATTMSSMVSTKNIANKQAGPKLTELHKDDKSKA